MIYSTSTKYAVIALMELASRQVDKPVQIREISDSTGIPRFFLAKLIQTLVKAGILVSSKGRSGGVRFAKPPSQITLAEVVKAIDGEDAFKRCIFGLGSCDGNRNCPLHTVWGPIRNQILIFLRETTIADLTAEIGSKEVLECVKGGLGR